MNYKLCKELRDGGFPQNHVFLGKNISWVDKCIKCSSVKGGNEPYEPCDPTLPELIDECGPNFKYLFRIRRDEFQAHGDKFVEGLLQDIKSEIESTQEEAMAKLWLLINK